MIVRDDKSAPQLYCTLLVVLALTGMLVLLVLGTSGLLLQLAVAFVGGSLLLLLLIYLVTQFSRWRRMNRRRQAAASSDQSLVPLASMQLTPDEQALPVPFTLRLKVNWHVPVGLIVFFYMLFSSGILFLIQGRNWLHFLENDWTNYNIEALVIISIYTLVGPLLKRPKVQVSRNALMIGLSTFYWSDAKLFAVRGRGRPGDPARQFELSGVKEALVWEYLRPNPWWSPYKPPMPCDDYEQQMAHLLEFIAAKTNLPLYDVR